MKQNVIRRFIKMAEVESMKESNVGGVSQGIIEKVKKTKNTSIKNLTVKVYHEDKTSESVIKNMCQVWKFIKSHYTEPSNMKDEIQVIFNGEVVKDIHAEKKHSGKVWMVDKMQVGKNTVKKI